MSLRPAILTLSIIGASLLGAFTIETVATRAGVAYAEANPPPPIDAGAGALDDAPSPSPKPTLHGTETAAPLGVPRGNGSKWSK